MIIDRYLEAGLRRNPFAALDPAATQQVGFCDRGLATPPLPGSTTLVQVIGDQGAGKTSQVQAWRRQIEGPYHYVPAQPYKSRWVRPPVDSIVYADEIDRMPRLLRQLWFSRLVVAGATVVAGTHVDLSAQARRAGLRVVTHKLGPVDLATLRSIVQMRFQQVRVVTSSPTFQLSEADLRWIHERCGGSIRGAEIHAHELVARRVAQLTNSPKVIQP